MSTIFRAVIFSFILSGCQSLGGVADHLQCADAAKDYLGYTKEKSPIFIENCKACMSKGRSPDECFNESAEKAYK